MARKPKDNIISIAEEQNEPPRPMWPESTENRCLRCDVTPQEAVIFGKEQSELIQSIETLNSQKKASASHYKAAIDEKAARASRLAGYITTGWIEKDVPCHWAYETAGRDAATGELIIHPEKKTLIRNDTGDVVEIRDITSEERQMALPIDGPADDEEE